MSGNKVKYKHIFCDLDNTIWDFDGNSADTLREIFTQFELKKAGIQSAELFIAKYLEINKMMWMDYRKGLVKKELMRVERFARTLAYFQIHDEGLPNRISEAYLELCPMKTKLIPDVHETLSYLSKDYDLHIITNGFEEVQHRKLDISDLRRYFKHVICSESAGVQKPDPKIFEFALRKAGAELTESIFIGDSLVADMIGAQAFGLDQVYLNRKGKRHREKFSYEIKSLAELKEIF